MFHPSLAYEWLAEQPAVPGKWTALRRPLFFAFLLGCMVSLVASQRLTLRHVIGGAVSGACILLAQIFGLAIVRPREVRPRDGTISLSRSIDLFFAGYGPWIMWILAFSTVWAFASTLHAFRWAGSRTIVTSFTLAALWSAYIDLCFFKRVFHRAPRRAVWDLLLQRVISWTLAILIFGEAPLLPEIIRRLGR